MPSETAGVGWDPTFVGYDVRSYVGYDVGWVEGLNEDGPWEGCKVGYIVGNIDGVFVGIFVSDSLGIIVGKIEGLVVKE